MILFGFPSELNHFHDIELSAEEHEPIECQIIERLRHVIEGDGSFVLILDGEPGVVFEDDFELVFIHMYHF